VQVILQLINREDRGTVYYDGSRIVGRYARAAAGRARTRARAKAAAVKAAAAATAAKTAAVEAHRAKVRNRRGVRARKKRPRQDGGLAVNHTAGQFISQTGYHTASAKQSRRSARQTESRRLSVKKYGRYSQLM